MKPTYEILRELNTATKYPSIPTYHTIDKGILIDEEVVSYPTGVPIIGTEKVDGCLPGLTRVTMADGSWRRLKDLVVGDEVLGVENGKIVATSVTNTFNNGRGATWMKLRGPRIGAGRGNNFFQVFATPNHKFWNPEREEYIAVEKLSVGDSIAMLRNELELTPLQKSVLLGKLLGDGYLSTRKNSFTSAVTWGHRVEDEEYNSWTLRALGDMACSTIRTRISGYGTEMHDAHSLYHPSIRETFGNLIVDGTKTVPNWVADALDPIAIAFWYMDDGSLMTHKDQEDRARFATDGFTPSDCDVLLRGLRKFNIYGRIQWTKNRPELSLNADEAEKLFMLVAPYIPPVMQRKLPERYRGHEGWLPPSKSRQYKSVLVDQVLEVIEEVDPRSVNSSKFDIETDTHNFFANNILVHNSNVRLIFMPSGEWLIGSREELLHAGGDIVFNPSQGIVEAVRDIAHNIYDVMEVDSNSITVVYGEVFGAKITGAAKNYTTTGTNTGFQVFDVAEIHDATWTLSQTIEWISGERERQELQTWWTEDELQVIAAATGVELTPRLFKINDQPWSKLPTTIAGMEDFLRDTLPSTRVALDESGLGVPEGIVLRTPDRKVISKARFQDYAKTLRKKGAKV